MKTDNRPPIETYIAAGRAEFEKQGAYIAAIERAGRTPPGALSKIALNVVTSSLEQFLDEMVNGTGKTPQAALRAISSKPAALK